MMPILFALFFTGLVFMDKPAEPPKQECVFYIQAMDGSLVCVVDDTNEVQK